MAILNPSTSSKIAPKKILVITIIVLLVQLLFDPISLMGNFAVKQEGINNLITAKALWKSTGITSYRIRVRGAVPLGCIYDAIITIHNNELVNVQAKKSFDENSEYVTINKQNWNNRSCDYTQLTINQVFSDANNILNDINPINAKLEITFDPTYGFITRYQFRYSSYGLLTSSLVSDCCSWYEFSGFQPVK